MAAKKVAKKASGSKAKPKSKSIAMPKKSAKPKAAAKSAKPAAKAGKTAARSAQPARAVMAKRPDLGAPVAVYFERQQGQIRSISERLHALVQEIAPDCVGALKWGMPFYTIGGGMFCAIAGFKAHVSLILSGPKDAFADPQGLLADGDSKTGRRLNVRSEAELPVEQVKTWLRVAADRARQI